METLWFCLFWATLSTFVVFAGTDIGVGILHLFVARTEDERTQVIRAIRQVWKPNEVWLIVSGGVMFVAFPQLLATALSGFYLAIILVLWLLIGRGMGIDLRGRIDDPMWRHFWDLVFWASSTALTICLGAALGNFVRGVALDEHGVFFEAFWTNFQIGPQNGILDWYTILVGITAVIALTRHGALWLNRFTDGPVQQRSDRCVRSLWLPLVIAMIACGGISFIVQPQVRANLASHPWGILFPLVVAAALAGCRRLHLQDRPLRAYMASGAMLYAVMASAAFGLYPYVMPARDPQHGLTAFAAAAPKANLQSAIYWWVPGMFLAACYIAFIYSKLPAKFPIGGQE